MIQKNIDKTSSVLQFGLRGITMLANEIPSIPAVVKGKLVKNISYKKDGQIIYVQIGTSVLVDMDNLIAFVNGDHTDISSDEFEIINMN